jgi:hypothetical protein
MNGNVTRDGITRDLEAMKRAGLGGVLIFDGGTYLPEGPAKYLSQTWRDLMAHAIREAGRLGLDVAMHNGPGWSSSGGPWVTPERSMQQMVWSETTVSGSRRIDIALPRPYAKQGFFRDSAVVAFPAVHREEWRMNVRLAAKEHLQFAFAEPFEARSITVFANPEGRSGGLRLEASDDGATYREVVRVSFPGRRGIDTPGSENFPPVRARFFRLAAAGACDLAEVSLSQAPRIHDWIYKANFAYRVGRQIAKPAEGGAEFGIDPASVRDVTAQMDSQGRHRW